MELCHFIHNLSNKQRMVPMPLSQSHALIEPLFVRIACTWEKTEETKTNQKSQKERICSRTP